MKELQYDLNYIRYNIYSMMSSNPIGGGNFGKVFKLSPRNNGIYYAIKKIVVKGNIKHIKREMGILDRINNRNIIKIYDHFDINENEYYLVLEYVPNGTLDDKINNQRKSKTPFQEIEIIRIFKQIINGIIYLHDLNIVQRDIKPDNILFDEFDNVKLTDFGYSVLLIY